MFVFVLVCLIGNRPPLRPSFMPTMALLEATIALRSATKMAGRVFPLCDWCLPPSLASPAAVVLPELLCMSLRRDEVAGPVLASSTGRFKFLNSSMSNASVCCYRYCWWFGLTTVAAVTVIKLSGFLVWRELRLERLDRQTTTAFALARDVSSGHRAASGASGGSGGGRSP